MNGSLPPRRPRPNDCAPPTSWNGSPGNGSAPAASCALVRRGHQLAFGLTQGLAPFRVSRNRRHRTPVQPHRIADLADPAEQVGVVDEGLVAALAVVVQRLLEELGGPLVIARAAVLDGGLMKHPVI